MALIPYPYIGGFPPRSRYDHTSLEIKLGVGWPYVGFAGTSTLGARSVGVLERHGEPLPAGETVYLSGASAGVIKVGSTGALRRSTLYPSLAQVSAVSYGGLIKGAVISGSNTDIIKVSSFSDFYFGVPTGTAAAGYAGFVRWSDIGHLDFTEGKDNVAGHMPLDWRGTVYSIRKFRNKVIVYGAGGVSFLNPVGTSYGLETFYRVGLKGAQAVCGDESKQFFIDSGGKMWKIADSLELLDYSEFLGTFGADLVMTYDKLNNLVYICDNTNGYVYDVAMNSLGKGPAKITAYEYQAGTSYIGASDTISIPAFEICTDIYDLGTRAAKTIYWVEFGTDLTGALYASIDYRRSKAASFTQTPWYLVPSNGRVHLRAYGVEFRFRAKLLTYEYFELDYIKVYGVADDY